MAFPALPTTQDEKTFEKLASKIATDRLIAFVGAGMSVRAGFGDWEALLDKLRKQAEAQLRAKRVAGERQHQLLRRKYQLPKQIDVDDLSWLAEEVRDDFRGQHAYLSILKSHFSRNPGKPDPAILAFAKLPFTHVFTTNYDRSLENAMLAARRKWVARNWRNDGVPGKVMRSFASPPGDPTQLVYLHGRGPEPKTIVLSERDYREMYVRSDETVKKLFAIFSLRSTVFFGFSLRDLDVLSVFRQVRASIDDTAHFALMPDLDPRGKPLKPDERESHRNRYAAKFGVEVIFYRPGKEFQNFEKCLTQLAKGDGSPRVAHAPKRSLARVRANGEPSSRRTRQKVRRARTRWTETNDFKHKRAVADPEDPQKGRFGGSPRCNGRELTAVVTEDSSGWFDVKIEVRSLSARRPLRGKVDIWVHDSFPREHYYTFATNGVAKYSFVAYGAFTVGATCDGGRTPLELDLSKLRNAPARFKTS